MTGIVFLYMMGFICYLNTVDSRPHETEAGTGFRITREHFNDKEFQKPVFGNPAGDKGIRHKRNVKDYDNSPKVAMNDAEPSGERKKYPFLGDSVETFLATLAAALPPPLKPMKEWVSLSPRVYNPFE